MNANAYNKPLRATQGKPVKAQPAALGASGRLRSDRLRTLITESSGDLTWVELCKMLSKPALLLAVTGFGEL